jgi:hypothetical protein
VFFQRLVDSNLVKDAETVAGEIDGAADSGVSFADFVDHAIEIEARFEEQGHGRAGHAAANDDDLPLVRCIAVKVPSLLAL